MGNAPPPISHKGSARAASGPMKFNNQAALFDHINNTPPDDLEAVEEVAFVLQDVDIAPLLRGTAAQNLPRPSLTQLYDEELKKLSTAFHKLPVLAKVTVRMSGSMHSFVYQDFLDRLVQQVRAQSSKIDVVIDSHAR